MLKFAKTDFKRAKSGSGLIDNIEKIHTTKMGVERIKRNLELQTDDVAAWCKQTVSRANGIIRKGKNWYVSSGDCVITINAHSYTIITAHKIKIKK
ncbi:MAG: DUF3781 domain-containing protein [Chitinispirillales bacterium]|nr:DUF3781 domain-containing protein [Chitinispirillales bacterium]